MEQGAKWLLNQLQGYGYKDQRLERRMEKVVEQLAVSDLSQAFPAIFTKAKRPFEEKESSKWALSCGQQVASVYHCTFTHIMD